MSILGVIVRCRVADLAEIERSLRACPGVSVADRAEADGRLVVVIEDSADMAAAVTMAQIAARPKVLNVSLVYEYSGPDSPGPQAEADPFQAWRRGPVAPAAQHTLT